MFSPFFTTFQSENLATLKKYCFYKKSQIENTHIYIYPFIQEKGDTISMGTATIIIIHTVDTTVQEGIGEEDEQ